MSPKKFQSRYAELVRLLEKLKEQPDFKTKRLAIENLENDINRLNNVRRKESARYSFEQIASECLSQDSYVRNKTVLIPEEARNIFLEMARISVYALEWVDVDV